MWWKEGAGTRGRAPSALWDTVKGEPCQSSALRHGHQRRQNQARVVGCHAEKVANLVAVGVAASQIGERADHDALCLVGDAHLERTEGGCGGGGVGG